MFCGNCGTKIEDGYKSCPKCEAKVSVVKTAYAENDSKNLLPEKNKKETPKT